MVSNSLNEAVRERRNGERHKLSSIIPSTLQEQENHAFNFEDVIRALDIDISEYTVSQLMNYISKITSTLSKQLETTAAQNFLNSGAVHADASNGLR